MQEPYVVKLTISREEYEKRKEAQKDQRLKAEVLRFETMKAQEKERAATLFRYGNPQVNEPTGVLFLNWDRLFV